jgi:hypothetical protein
MLAVRRVTAILAADVAGYSRLMGADEKGPHERLRGHLRALIEAKISEYRGRIVKNTGDGFLAEFASVVDAVRALCRRSGISGSATRCRGLCKEFNVIAGGKRIEAQIRSCVGVLVALLDRREAGLNLVNGRAEGAYAIRETAKIALHAD